jgi:hypothetical protein
MTWPAERENRSIAVHHVHGEQQRDAESRFFDRHLLQPAKRFGARDVQVRAHGAGTDAFQFGIVEAGIQGLAAPPARWTSCPSFSSKVIFLSRTSGRDAVCANDCPAQDKTTTAKQATAAWHIGRNKSEPPHDGVRNLPEGAVCRTTFNRGL